MATLTTLLGLHKPAMGDTVGATIPNLAADMQTIDEEFSRVWGGIAGQDYEKGTCTLFLTGASTPPNTPISVTGEYVRVGNLVNLNFAFLNRDTTGASGTLQITGLPFVVESGNYCFGSIRSGNMFTDSVSLYAAPKRSYLVATALLSMAEVDISAGTNKSLYGSITYVID